MTSGARVERLRALRPSRPAIVAGLRGATATVVPLVIGEVTGHPRMAAMALGGWLGSMADPGGAYAARSRSMLAFIVGGALAAFLATLGGVDQALLVPLTFLFVSAAAMLRVYGDAGATNATLICVVFCVDLGAGLHTSAAALENAALVAAGGVVAAVLALVVWPVRPYDPVRGGVGATYHALAEYARGIAGVARVGGQREARSALASLAPGRVRATLEAARGALGETRAGRLGRSEPADLLVDLIEGVDRIFALLVGVAEEIAAMGGAEATRPVVALAGESLDALARTLDAAAGIARPAVLGGRSEETRDAEARASEALDRAVVALWEVAERHAPGATDGSAGHGAVVAGVHAARAAALIEEAATEAQGALERVGLARWWRTPHAGAVPPATPHVEEVRVPMAPTWRARWWAPLANNLTTDSLVLRHALRVGVAVAAATWLGGRLPFARGIWVTTTVLVLLQPYAGVTLTRGVQRVAGTVGGGVVAALLAFVLREPLTIAAAMFPMSLVAVAVRRLHYGLYTFFLTPVFVLMAERSMGDWRLALARIASTLVGAAMALVASRVLWPSWEHERLPGQLAALVAAARRHFRAVAAPLVGEPAPESADEARRKVGLASNNAEAALQRFVGEPRGDWGEIESLASFLAQVRRVNGATVALGLGPAPLDGASEIARAIDAALGEIAVAAHERRAPHPLPPPLALPIRTGEYAVIAPARGAAALISDAPLARVAHAVQRLHAVAERLARRA